MSRHDSFDQSWPPLAKSAFQKTSHLLHMCVQILGKIMLTTPFEPHWANVAMPLTSRGITTGVIPYQRSSFTIDVDFISHEVLITTSTGEKVTVKLGSMSVKELYDQIFDALHSVGITLHINTMPQEVPHPVAFEKDTEVREYDEAVVHAWWRIMLSCYCVLMKFHATYYGITPKIGLFWGTLDLRDARYKGTHLPVKGSGFNYITRNAMDDAQFEVGWSASNAKYLTPSFFAFAYPKAKGYENAPVKPEAAKWVPAINEFVLDYNDLRKSKDPEADLLLFFQTSFEAFAKMGQWDTTLIVSGKPV